MSSIARLLHRASFVLLFLSAVVIGLGVWGQIEHNRLGQARAEVFVTLGQEGVSALPVPAILRPFEDNMIPLILLGDSGNPTVFGVFSRLGGAIGLMGLLLFTLRGGAPAPRLPEAEDVEPEPPTMQQAQAVPIADWQRRLKEKYEPRQTQTSGRLAYRAVLAVVALAFVTLSAAVILGNSGSAANIDFAAMIAQARAQLESALQGDQTSMIALGKMAAVALGIVLILAVLMSRLKPSRRAAVA
ncbi:MAG: hypothetical protein NTX73_13055 [Rhodobacterales bacterium]|nr:hypothetical protein [Rhodobacterales bacterium]